MNSIRHVPSAKIWKSEPRNTHAVQCFLFFSGLPHGKQWSYESLWKAQQRKKGNVDSRWMQYIRRRYSQWYDRNNGTGDSYHKLQWETIYFIILICFTHILAIYLIISGFVIVNISHYFLLEISPTADLQQSFRNHWSWIDFSRTSCIMKRSQLCFSWLSYYLLALSEKRIRLSFIKNKTLSHSL